jgi:UTP--glucose-1-phosphate uridylyltransferase
MTSEGTHAAVGDYLSQLPQSPYIAPLLEELGWTGLHFRTAKQELIATFTLPDQQGQSDFFVLGPPESPKLRPLPGGHGQNFRVLQGSTRTCTRKGTFMPTSVTWTTSVTPPTLKLWLDCSSRVLRRL